MVSDGRTSGTRGAGLGECLAVVHLAVGTRRLPTDTVLGGANVVRLGLIGECGIGEGRESTISGTASPGVTVFGGLCHRGMVLSESRRRRKRWIGERMRSRLGGSVTPKSTESSERRDSAVGTPDPCWGRMRRRVLRWTLQKIEAATRITTKMTAHVARNGPSEPSRGSVCDWRPCSALRLASSRLDIAVGAAIEDCR